jgi:hypothetical protein
MVQCDTCGQIWERDPILEVACPTCHAPAGSPCRRPSGHQAADYHAARDLLAMGMVPGYGRCPKAETKQPPASEMQAALPLF